MMIRKTYDEDIARLKDALSSCDAVVIGAGAGLSTAAGFRYSGEIFERYFRDFKEKYSIRDIYSGGFYPFPSETEYWAWWSRHIWINRYVPMPGNLYGRLLEKVKDREYFVITTNVDHCFQRAGFDKERLFYTQGDYGLFQSCNPHGASQGKTYDNEESVRRMLLSQGFVIEADGTLLIPEKAEIRMSIDPELIPVCPDDGERMVPNLRSDDTFVEDEGWQKAARRYAGFLQRYRGGKVLFLELGVGGNTPVIIKYPFWRYTAENANAVYACINMGEAVAPQEIMDRSILLDEDIAKCVEDLF